MEVIDLFEDNGRANPVDDFEQNGARITSREGRKAAKQIFNNNPKFGWDVVTNCVLAFCKENPALRDIPTIVQRCEQQLKAPVQPAAVGASNNSKPAATALQATVIDYSDYGDGGDDDDVVIHQSTPLLEVLRMFPNAKRGYVEQQLEKSAYRIEVVVQDMLDKGYEKEDAPSSAPAAQPSTPAVDYTSSTWETSATYRKDAVTELQRNFPFLTLPSLTQYFKKEKFHFYHSLLGLEKQLKVTALHFTQCRVQNVLASLASGADAAAAGITTATTGTSSSAAATSSANSNTATVAHKAGPITIDLMGAQPQFEVEEVTGLFRTGSRPPVQYLDQSPTGRGSKGAKGRRGGALTSSGVTSPVKYLTKEQLSELRTRCDRDNTGLAAKTAVLCVYTSSTEDNISYILQPLDSVLSKEIDFIHEQRRREMLQADQLAAEKLNEEMATAEGGLMECGCCYGEYAFEALVQCSEGHLFCKTCLQRYCEQTVFGNGRSVIKCMNTAEVCPGFFSDTMLEKVFEKFNQALSRDALSAAHIEGLVTCHHCAVPMLLEEDAGNVLHCPYCSKETCRLCGEPSHVPLRCSEVEKKGDTSTRLSVEEAMTQARLRECPKCKTRFFKTEGCNKMTCSCGMIICYICRKDISKTGYQHFCQTAHCTHASCNKCRLFTDTLEDDRVAMKEAGLQTLQLEQQKQAAEGGTGAANGTKTTTENPGAKVDLEKLLEASNKPPGAPGAPAGRAVIVAGAFGVDPMAAYNAAVLAAQNAAAVAGRMVFAQAPRGANAAQRRQQVREQLMEQQLVQMRQQLQQQDRVQQQQNAARLQAQQLAQQQEQARRQLLAQQRQEAAAQAAAERRQLKAEQTAARQAAKRAETLARRAEAAERKRQEAVNRARAVRDAITNDGEEEVDTTEGIYMGSDY